jgi:hypothetical protein
MAITAQNGIRGIACGLIAFSFMLLGFCAYASGMVSSKIYLVPVLTSNGS